MYKYFNRKLSAGFVALFTGRMLQFAGNGFIGLFLPVYLYINFGMNITYVFAWYLIGHVAYAIILPWGAQFFNKFGMRRSLRISVFVDALYLGCVYLIAYNLVVFTLLSLFLLPLPACSFGCLFMLILPNSLIGETEARR